MINAMQRIQTNKRSCRQVRALYYVACMLFCRVAVTEDSSGVMRALASLHIEEGRLALVSKRLKQCVCVCNAQRSMSLGSTTSCNLVRTNSRSR